MFTNICRALLWLIARVLSALASAAMMLLHLLLHVLIYHLLSAKEGPKDTAKSNEDQRRVYVSKPKDTNYVVKRIGKCPTVGYYFTREPAPNAIDPGTCYLCFCHGEQTAVCWKRDNRRCNVDSFYYLGLSKRDESILLNQDYKNARARRSPGFADIFFRDASRDVFNRNTEEQQCKPFESSFSEDCPPADWCIGCTVCDCDPNGRWDCHVLSFCPEDKKGKNKKQKGPPRKVVKKKPLPKSSPAPQMKTTTPGSRWSRDNKKNTVTPKRVANRVSTVKSSKQQPKKKPSLRYQKMTPKGHNTKPMVIKKNIATHKPIELKGQKVKKIMKNHDNNTVILAQQVVRKVMAAVRQMVHNEMRNVTRLVSGGRSELNNTNIKQNNKNVGKRPTKKQDRHKRDVIYADFNATTSSSTIKNLEEEKLTESTIVPETNNITPTTINLLKPDVDYFTIKPTPNSTHSENEYYKYVVAKENVTYVIPLVSELTTTIDTTNIITKNEVQTNGLNKTDTAVVNKTYAEAISKIATNEIFKIENDVVNKTHVVAINKTDVVAINKTDMVAINKTDTDAINKTDVVAINRTDVDAINKTNVLAIDKTNMVTINTTNVVGNNKTDVNETKMELNVVQRKSKPITAHSIYIVNNANQHTNTPNTLKYLNDFHSAVKSLNFTRWYHFKKVKSPESKFHNIVKLIVNKTADSEESKYKLRSKNYGRITLSKKQNILKILKRHKCPFLNDVLNENDTTVLESGGKDVHNLLGDLWTQNQNNITKQSNKLRKFNIINENETAAPVPGRKVIDVHNLLGNLWNPNHTNITKQSMKIRKFYVIKYLKKIFNKLFKRKNTTGHVSRNHIIATICENFGPCTKGNKNKELLKSKVSELDHETMTILKTVKIIKGLLRLLNGSQSTNQNNLQYDVHRLNSILRGNYTKNSNEPLSETQLIQIEYIKRNTQKFVASVGRFTTLLNEIINILTKREDNDKTDDRTFVKKDSDINNPFERLKHLLSKYNLVQNNFMKKMYKLLNTFEGRKYEKPLVSANRKLNSSLQVEIYSRNIFKNLRKLKHLAQTLSYNGRNKREARDDDPVEYLLMLMEYLLKQNNPLDAAPVNDGIDLLIEAIKNAPDIKTIRKKVLDNTPAPELETVTVHMPDDSSNTLTLQGKNEDNPTSNYNENQSEIDSDKIKVENNENILKTKIEDDKDILDMVEDDKDSFDRFQFDRGAEFTSMYVTTESSYSPAKPTPVEKHFSNVQNTVITTVPLLSPSQTTLRGDMFNNADLDNNNIFNANPYQGIADNDNNFNVGYSTIENGKNSDTAQDFNNNGDNSNIETVNNNINGNIPNNHIENKNVDLRKNNNNGDIFNDNIENINIGFEKSDSNDDSGNDNNFDDHKENRNTDLETHNKSSSIFTDNIESIKGYKNVPQYANKLNSIPDNDNNDENNLDKGNINDAVTQVNATMLTIDNGVAEKDGGIKKFQPIYTEDIDEESLLTPVYIELSSTTTELAESLMIPLSKSNTILSLDTVNESSNKNIKLEWIDENFDKEDKNYDGVKYSIENQENSDTNTTTSVTIVPDSVVTRTQAPKAYVSYINNEGNGSEKKKEINTEEVMIKKQMDLLSSLDYGTEKAEFDESHSKDGNAEERYSDSSAYFV